jgi:hypothetical protein
MLLAKPLYLRSEHKKRVAQGYAPAARRPSSDHTGEVTPMVQENRPAEAMQAEPVSRTLYRFFLLLITNPQGSQSTGIRLW